MFKLQKRYKHVHVYAAFCKKCLTKKSLLTIDFSHICNIMEVSNFSINVNQLYMSLGRSSYLYNSNIAEEIFSPLS